MRTRFEDPPPPPAMDPLISVGENHPLPGMCIHSSSLEGSQVNIFLISPGKHYDCLQFAGFNLFFQSKDVYFGIFTFCM